ncbi:MAG: type II toxin-antitoxin system HigB family toxin [Bacteroidia bacterium]|nr:type II toxin-antitoxin system HigB family toxin [Bacteroidia bacterium]
MRVIAVSTLRKFWEKHSNSEEPLKAWYDEVIHSEWTNSNELKTTYKSASIINSKRVVFNIKGNDYRLVVDIEYRLKIIFIVWVGTHGEYDKIDVKAIDYVKTNKK